MAESSRCSICKKLLELSEKNFYKNKHKKKGFSTECRKCKSDYQKNRRVILLQRRKNFISLNGSKCNKCSVHNINPSFFDIDHIIPVVITKEKRSLPSFYDERFQVLCPNCHREKTIKENNARKNKEA